MLDKRLIIIIGFLILAGVIAWAFIESSKPLPGEHLADLGRDHVADEIEVQYNSNPPTSGSHNADWIRKGVYSHPENDRYLIHSLEHGFVIMSYNCDFAQSLIPTAYAHLGEEEEATSSSIATGSARLSEAFKSDDCQKLKDGLVSVYNKKGQKKLIVVPRPNLDSKLALTAWRRIDKFNELDIARIEKFIDTHRDKGPEQTME